MTLDQLRVFIAVAERGHVTRAAEELRISQSAASAAIAALEARYRTKLFDRVGRGIELTETGRLFLREARAVLDQASQARSVLEDLGGFINGTVSIAASHTTASYWLPKRLATFHAANPEVRFNVVIRNTTEVEAACVDGEVNFGLVEGPTQHPAIVRLPVDHDHLMLVVAANQSPPFDKKGKLDLRAVTWILREAGSGTRRGLEDLASREGLTLDDLDIFLVLSGNEAIREAVEAGLGTTIISEHVVASAISAGLLRAYPIDLPPRDFALLRHRDRHISLAQRALMQHLVSAQDNAGMKQAAN
jgi:DNA-binding transcriptional LysR family regulator